MKLTETPLLDEESMSVLAVAYRARPASVQALASFLESPSVQRLDATLTALERAGFVRVRSGRLALESPYAAFIAISQARTSRLEEETMRTVTMMDALPFLIRNWDLGEAKPGEDHPLVARLAHGKDRWHIWRRHLVEERPVQPSWVLPDVAVLRETFAAHADDITSVLAAGHMRPRMLVRPSDLHDPANQELAAAAVTLGVEVRVLDELPSWFYVDEDRLAALPVGWGEQRPASVLLAHTPPIIAVLNLLFDTLWHRAEPAVAETRGWEPVIRLLAQGLTDDAIGRFLGLDVRTVRRRVSEAMQDLNTTSRFGLGMAWARREL